MTKHTLLLEEISGSLQKDQYKLTDEEKIVHIASHFREILKVLGLDLNHESLQKTPERVAKMYVKELFSGLDQDNFPETSFLEEEEVTDSMVLIKDITIHSICEHHFVPMMGKAHIAYFPSSKLIGLSKINRIASYFSKRPQIQERLTLQIGQCLSKLLETDDIAVSIELNHFCVSFRGICDTTSLTHTEYLKGKFKHDALIRQEFFQKIS